MDNSSKAPPPLCPGQQPFMMASGTLKYSTEGQNMNTYKIVRFHINKPSETIKEGLTLEEAQTHCQSDDTRGMGWFDGYEKDEK